MKTHLIAVALCLLASPVSAQEPKPTGKPAERTIILDISMVEVNLSRAEDLEKIAKDKEQLNNLIAAGKARPIASLQMRARSGEQSSARIGQRVPVQTASLPAFAESAVRQRRAPGQQPGGDPNNNAPAAPEPGGIVGISQIQYENTGISVTALPNVVGDQIEVRINFEMTGLQKNTGALTPTFIQRSVSDVVRVRESETALLLGLVQHETLWPSLTQPSSAQPPDQSRGSFIVLLSARLID